MAGTRSAVKRFLASQLLLIFAFQATAHALSNESIPVMTSPLGYVSAINTPVAQVLQMGTVAASLANNVPEKSNPYPGIGGFGTLNMGLSLLEGLETFGRLSFSGDLQCNMHLAGCQSGQRDLSVSAKYQLPIKLPMNTRLATGVTDYGGAATNFRSKYFVATSDLGVLDVSVGYAQKSSSGALLNGSFGSVVVRVTEQLKVQYENDSKTKRIGAAYFFNLGKYTDLSLGISQQRATATQIGNRQVNAVLVMNLGQKQSKLIRETEMSQPQHLAEQRAQVNTTLELPPVKSEISKVAKLHKDVTRNKSFKNLEIALKEAGFGRIHISASSNNFVWIQVEPVAWRKSKLQAMGKALQALLMQHELEYFDQWLITLTHEGWPVLNALTNSHCAQSFKAGFDFCADHAAVEFFSHSELPNSLTNKMESATPITTAKDAVWLAPQFEIGFNLRSSLATEYGLADYSAALELTSEVALAKGLGLQITASAPLSHSGDFSQGHVFADRLHMKTQMTQALLTYWQPFGQFAVQGSAGYINATDRGGQLDGTWHNRDGRLRLSGLVGRYNNTEGRYVNDRMPSLASMRYSILPAKWQVELTAGQFYNQDRGYLLATHHQMGDTQFKIYLRKTGLRENLAKPVRNFAGIEISLPLGPDKAGQVAGFSVRGQDRWQTSAETKVGTTDNILTLGYGLVPKPKHGLMTDVIDFDRSGYSDIWADRDRVRLAMRNIH